jgi:Cellulase (glycosyl hydrolase family 5)/Carbohydrate binding module (family 6)/Secretion system C-terminal sorting domain
MTGQININKSLFSRLLFFVLILLTGQSFAQLKPWDAVAQMQKGINLGNTLEPPNEGDWAPKAQEYYFDMYKSAGFQVVRVPVRWDQHTASTPPYKIDETWLKRVEEVVDWGLKRDLFIIVNAHHEEWIKSNYSQANRDRFDSIWSQISVRFSNKSEKLFFEIINEPYGLTKAQNDDLHKRVLSVIRKTNPTRIVIFQGHNWGGSDELITAAIPDDPYLMGSFHSYDPYLFGLEGQGTWGSPGDYAVLADKFAKVKSWSDQNKIPVLLGEFGAVSKADYNSRMKHYKAYTDLVRINGFSGCAWDDGGDFKILLRNEKRWNDIKDILIHTSVKSPAPPVLQLYQDTVVKVSWTNTFAGCDSIRIERRTSSSSWQKLSLFYHDTTSYYDIKPYENQYYLYRIISWFKNGEVAYSVPQQIFYPKYVKPVRTPYHGSPAMVPGIVEAEDFDIGRNGFTYYDTDDLNLAGAYRPNEGVDIYDRNGKGYHVGNALPGEWLEYSLQVATESRYKIEFFLASLQGNGTFQVKIGDVTSDTLKAPVTYSSLTTKSASTVLNLKSGPQIMRFSILGNPSFNIDYFRFTDLQTWISDQGISIPKVIYNPDNEKLLIQSCSNQPFEKLNIYNISGRLIVSYPNPGGEIQIPVDGWTKGVYIVQGIGRNGKESKKIVIY